MGCIEAKLWFKLSVELKMEEGIKHKGEAKIHDCFIGV